MPNGLRLTCGGEPPNGVPSSMPHGRRQVQPQLDRGNPETKKDNEQQKKHPRDALLVLTNRCKAYLLELLPLFIVAGVREFRFERLDDCQLRDI
jgi:hypothetical protein